MIQDSKPLSDEDILKTADNLFELGKRLRSPGLSFKEEDIDHIDVIIGNLQELELMRFRAREAYETEAIKASALRYAHEKYPREINEEIERLVRAARGQNEGTIDSLGDQLDQLEAEIQRLNQETNDLDELNAQLKATLETKRLSHDQLVVSLNERLANKANHQIGLNEEFAKVKDCNKKIVLLEEDIVLLREDIAQEVKETEQHKALLMAETHENFTLFTAQRERNEALDKNLKITQHDVAETQDRINDLNRILRGHEKVIKRNQQEQKRLKNEIDQQEAENIQMKAKRENIQETMRKMEEDFQIWRKDVEDKILKLGQRIKREEKRELELKEKRNKLAEDLAEAEEIRNASAEKMKAMQEKLSAVKKEMAERAEDLGRLRQEIDAMEERVISLNETHLEQESPGTNSLSSISSSKSIASGSSSSSLLDDTALPQQLSRAASKLFGPDPLMEELIVRAASAILDLQNNSSGLKTPTEEETVEEDSTMALLQKQIAEMRDQLLRERDERLIVQNENDILQREIDEFRAANAKFMKEMNKKISDGKTEHTKLNNEHIQLTQGIREDRERAEQLRASIEQGKIDKAEMEAQLTAHIAQMHTDMESMKQQSQNREADIASMTPDFHDLEKYFNKTSDSYDQLKKVLVAFKNRKLGLEESTKRSTDQVERMKAPLKELDRVLEEKHEEMEQQLKRMETERMEVEKKIYKVGCQMKVAQLENARLKEEIAKMEAAIRQIREDWERVQREKSHIRKNTQEHKAHLKRCWDEDMGVLGEYAARDEVLISQMNIILNDTEMRQAGVARVTAQLQSELYRLLAFLKIVGNVKPSADGAEKPVDSDEDQELSTQLNRILEVEEDGV